MISNPEPRRVAEGLSRLLAAMAARREHARLLALPFAGALTLDRDGRWAGTASGPQWDAAQFFSRAVCTTVDHYIATYNCRLASMAGHLAMRMLCVLLLLMGVFELCREARTSLLAEATAVLQRRAARLDARSPERPYHLLYALHSQVAVPTTPDNMATQRLFRLQLLASSCQPGEHCMFHPRLAQQASCGVCGSGARMRRRPAPCWPGRIACRRASPPMPTHCTTSRSHWVRTCSLRNSERHE